MSTSTPARRATSRSHLQTDAVRSLTAVRSRTDRVRSRATTAAATGIGVVLLVAGAVITLGDGVALGGGPSSTAAGGGLAPFLAQPGLRPGVVVAAALLLLPLLTLAVQALRVGKVVEDRRARRLLTAGATWRDLRRLEGARTTAAFLRGALLAAPAYLVLWVGLGWALPAGSRLLPPLAWPLPLLWLAALGVLRLLGHLLAASSVRSRRGDAARGTGATRRAPSRLFVVVCAAAGVAVLGTTRVAVLVPALLPVVLVVAVVLLLLAAGAAAARTAVGSESRSGAALPDGPAHEHETAEGAGRRGRRTPPWRPRGRDTAVSLLADAQRRGSVSAVTGTAGVLFVCGLSFGVESSLVVPLLTPQDGSTVLRDDVGFYLGGTALAGVLGVVAAVVAIAALLLSLTDHLLGNRRAVASTAALGVETRRLVAVQARCLARTAVPVTVVGVLLGALPSTLPLVTGPAGEWSWVSLLPLAVAAVVGVLVAVLSGVLAAASAGRVRAAAALENLRVP